MSHSVQLFCEKTSLQVRFGAPTPCFFSLRKVTVVLLTRKCGRVVCNACSPHRIIIPHQYIVRPPGTEMPVPQSLLMDSLGVGYFDVNGSSGGERVRLCNPCVPDPNTAPPQNSTTGVSSPSSMSPRSSHQRSRSSMGNSYGGGNSSNRYGMVFASGQSHDPFQAYAPRSRSITMVS